MEEIIDWLLGIPILGDILRVLLIIVCCGILLLLITSPFWASDSGKTYGWPDRSDR